ncbi:MAG: hypothetical protein J1F11_09995, partial [Oscillospiraceae bacterium]|nr:hypothetical protein [Oscillospiraceae bacterium]
SLDDKYVYHKNPDPYKYNEEIEMDPEYNTYPQGKSTHFIFPCMHADFRNVKRAESGFKALSVYAHTPNSDYSSEKTILITTDHCDPGFIDKIEDALADVYLTGNLTAAIMLCTDDGLVNVPIYMNRRWDRPSVRLMNTQDIIENLGSPILFGEAYYDFGGPGEIKKYSININSESEIFIQESTNYKAKIVKGYAARKFIKSLLDFDRYAPDDIEYRMMDATTYYAHFSQRDYKSLTYVDAPGNYYGRTLIQIFKDLIGNL